MPHTTIATFERALRSLPRPGGRQLRFLAAHAAAPAKARTASQLARAAGYRSYGGVNLQYGLLAKRIGAAIGRPEADIGLLIEGVRPRSVTNDEWVLSMRPEFAAALQRVGWL